MAKSVAKRKYATNKSVRKQLKSTGFPSVGYHTIELLPDDLLGLTAESLYAVYDSVDMLVGYDRTAEVWEDLVDTTVLTFPPMFELTEIKFPGKVPVSTVKVKTVGKTLQLYLTFKYAEVSITANFIFPDHIIRLADAPKYYQRSGAKNSETMLRLMVVSNPEDAKVYTEDAYAFLHHTFNIAKYILLRLHSTLSCHQLMYTHARRPVINDGVVSVGTEDLLWISTKLVHSPALANIKIPSVLRLDYMEGVNNVQHAVVGSMDSLFSYFATCNKSAALKVLSDNSDAVVMVEEVNEESKKGTLLIGPNGLPLPTSLGDDLKYAAWALKPTGLTHKDTSEPLYACFTKESGGWIGFQLHTFESFYEFMSERLNKSFEKNRVVRELINKPKMCSGFTLSAWLGKGATLVEAFDYDCAVQMAEDMDEASTVKTVADISYYLRLLIWRARALNKQDQDTINTGLLRRDGGFMYVSIYNLYGHINTVTVRYLRDYSGEEKKPVTFYPHYSKLPIKRADFTYSDHGLSHMLLENKDRLGPELSNMPEPELIKAVRYSIEDAKRKLEVFPMHAQPFYSYKVDDINHFIPLYSEKGGHVLAALLIGGGVARTIYPLEWARQRAVCMGIPLADWLR